MPPASRNRFEFCFYRWTAMRLASVPSARWAPLLTVLLALLSTNWRQRLSRLQAGTDSQMAPKDWHSGKNGRHPAPLGELYAGKNMYKHTYIYITYICIYYLHEIILDYMHNYAIILNQWWLSAILLREVFLKRNWLWSIDRLEACRPPKSIRLQTWPRLLYSMTSSPVDQYLSILVNNHQYGRHQIQFILYKKTVTGWLAVDFYLW